MPDLIENARWGQKPDVVSCTLESGNALLDLSSSNYYTLNGSAAKIWEWIGREASVAELVERMMETYEVDRETCVADVKAIVASLEQMDLIVPSV